MVKQLAVIDYFLGMAQGLAVGGKVGPAVDDLKQARDIKKRLEKLINEHGCPG